jgi:hypothetical protein
MAQGNTRTAGRMRRGSHRTVTPDYAVELRRGVLEEIDGPMLVLGLQEFQTSRMLLIVVTARS